MKRVPRKNISRQLRDIYDPNQTAPRDPHAPIQDQKIAEFFLNRENDEASLKSGYRRIRVPSGHLRKFISVFLCIAVAGGGLLWYALRALEKRKLETASAQLVQLQRTFSGFPGSAPLSMDNPGFLDAMKLASEPSPQTFPGLGFAEIFGFLWPRIHEGGKALKEIQNFAQTSLTLASVFADLKARIPEYLLKREGDRLIEALKRARDLLENLEESNKKLASLGEIFRGPFLGDQGAAALPIALDISRLRDFLDTLVSWLDSSEEKHLLVFFGNTSELRPGGGFIGSYADIALRRASIENVEIRDVNDVDRSFRENIIPPKPLQVFRTRWRVADANWFFDFRESAAKVIELMEQSELYRVSSTVFEGAVGISPKVAGDLLALAGPINFPEYQLVITSENFLSEIQKQIELHRGQNDARPKRIIEKLAATLMDKVLARVSDQEDVDYSALASWLLKKDVLVYAKNPRIQQFLDHYGWTGTVYDLPADFFGDYLAVVNASVDSGKTDYVVAQDIDFQSQIESDGRVSDHVAVTRTHGGDKSSSWWYRVPSRTYLKVFTPPAARITSGSGGYEEVIEPRVNYGKGGYRADPLVAQAESTAKTFLEFPTVTISEEFGRNAFAMWTEVARGETKRAVFDYERKLPALPRDGARYKLVFERQAGNRSKVALEIHAPLGFVWAENNLPAYAFSSDDPDGRVIIDLTFKKL